MRFIFVVLSLYFVQNVSCNNCNMAKKCGNTGYVEVRNYTIEKCLVECTMEPKCKFSTFYDANNACEKLEKCDNKEDCLGCLTNEKKCFGFCKSRSVTTLHMLV